MTPLTDSFNRRLSYLRLSVTDLCNYRCSYCLPHGYQGKASPDELSLPEIETLVAAFAQSGTRKVRLTGGEATLPDALAYIKTHPVTLRFIELMQTGDNLGYFNRQHLSAAAIERRIADEGWQLRPRSPHAGPAREYTHPDFSGSIGFIAPYGKDFCTACNRLRVTSQGKMHLCLFGGVSHDLRPFLRSGDTEGLKKHLRELVMQKPEHHYLHDKKVGLITNLSMAGG